MQRTRRLAVLEVFLAALLASTSLIPTAQAQAQRPAFFGTFTLPYQVRWGGSVLPPGKYSVTIKSTGSPMIASVKESRSSIVCLLFSEECKKS